MLVRKFIAAKAFSVCLMATPAYAALTPHIVTPAAAPSAAATMPLAIP